MTTAEQSQQPPAKPIALTPPAEVIEQPRSTAAETLRRFRRHPLAIISVGWIIVLVALALGADVLRGIGFIDDPLFIHKAPAGSETRVAQAPAMTCTQDPTRMNPQWCFVLGVDLQGRDLMTQIVYGGRVSMAVGLVGAATAMIVGVLYGMIAGFYGGALDNIMMRFIDFLLAIPSLPLIILMQVILKTLADYADQLGPFARALVAIDRGMGGLFFVFIVIGLLSWTGIARLTRAQVLSYKQKEFIIAARAIGARDRRIILSHLLPNILGPLVLIGCLAVPGFIGTEAALSFLGIGVNADTPSWGKIINDAQQIRFAVPHLVIWPVLMLMFTILAFQFIADALRDALDPTLRGQ